MQQECAAKLQQTVCQKYAAGVCRNVAANCAPEVCSKSVRQGCSKLCARKLICIRKVYLRHTCSKLCARSVRQECARSVQETVCRRTNLHTKSLLAANLPQLVAAHLLQMRCKFAATVCHRAYILVREVMLAFVFLRGKNAHRFQINKNNIPCTMK